MPFWGKVVFQDFGSNIVSLLLMLHDFIMVWLVIILLVVLFVGLGVFFSMKNTPLSADSLPLEVTWSCVPMMVLISIALPSLFLLNKQEVFSEPFISLKLISSQWSWSSECGSGSCDHLLDFEMIEALSSLEAPVFLPESKMVRILLSSSDVLHSLGLPSLGVKLDSVPGRINSMVITGSSSMHIGSCFELCGTGHSAMPISLIFF